ncbi:hypothetical protein KDW_41620 [Dictyobacter vulcani]|uniref:DUF304 domain-containing protein n=1 Tax=Dictyobacter vulcani TaxID=2607529 RepID=A0A5J4KU64_9CHLR|nr:hypothetical protein [Dictyobacter vulcani]GER90000.1 hypothetical protein KDW_41620 [Dictyobacter vulcani]
MVQENQMSLWPEDEQAIIASNLGSPFAAYRISRRYIQLYSWGTYILIFMAVIAFILFFLIIFKAWYEASMKVNEYEDIYLRISSGVTNSIVTFVPASLFACYFRLVFIPQLKYNHIVLCESGLIYAEKKLRANSVQAIHWRDIQGVAQQGKYGNVVLSYMQDSNFETLIISGAFEQLDDLLENVSQKMLEYKESN